MHLEHESPNTHNTVCRIIFLEIDWIALVWTFRMQRMGSRALLCVFFVRIVHSRPLLWAFFFLSIARLPDCAVVDNYEAA